MLIVNRNEIALRVIATCHSEGIKTVVIYTEEDKFSQPVYKSDEAYLLSKNGLEGYVNQEEIILIAKKCGADAIHPGYGFLSENSEFAQKVIDANITWIGPSPKSIYLMGNKVEARNVMQKLEVPTIPGAHCLDSSENSKLMIKESAKIIGYPVILKAALGGGGRAQRKINNTEEFDEIWDKVISESKKQFSSDEIFLEKYITNGRHIEIQVAGDGKDAIHLYERECSIQRRNQKIIEEAPCKFVSKKLLEKMYLISTDAIKKLKYNNVGTIEYIVTQDEEFYFLEMNTRLQVEHPVTEATTGVDLVWLQLEIAKNNQLPLVQSDIQQRGHAIECRIIAENPYNNFSPSSGRMKTIHLPHGPYIRHEHAIEVGNTISPLFDSMISKLIAYGHSRNTSLKHMIQALNNFSIVGIKTNISFLKKLLSLKEFSDGSFHTQWLELNLKELSNNEEEIQEREITNVELAIISTLLVTEKEGKTTKNFDDGNNYRGWRNLAWR
ncbi:ATP-grasp domain-containing protein [Candidatus Babeliales bacterium]|nr:ATP-grasp domain-containing protein [Candidatus Babeliales bacterium]